MVKQGESTGGWRTSSYSAGGNCVEVSVGVAEVLVRDSKEPGGPMLAFPVAAFAEFIQAVKGGEFDLG